MTVMFSLLHRYSSLLKNVLELLRMLRIIAYAYTE